jgi:2-dehydropantoate 2-reductase
MRIAVVGAGALGSLFGALLALKAAENGDEIWLVGSTSTRPHLDAIVTGQGLHLELAPGVSDPSNTLGSGQPFLLKNIYVTTNPGEAFPADLALVLVKSYRSVEAAQQAKKLIARDGLVLSLQNGLGNLEILAETVGAEHAAQGITSLGATLPSPGTVRWMGVGPVSLGVTPELNEKKQQLLQAFAERLSALNLEVIFSNNIAGLVWGKLIINCGINAAGALLNVSNGEMAVRPAARAILEAAATEAASVAQALNIQLPYPYEAAAEQARLVALRTAPNLNSMLIDLRRGGNTEIEAINGAVVRAAATVGLPVPVNWTLTQLIRGWCEGGQGSGVSK